MQSYNRIVKRLGAICLLLLTSVGSASHAAEIDPSRFANNFTMQSSPKLSEPDQHLLNGIFSRSEQMLEPLISLQVFVHGFLASTHGMLLGRPVIKILDVGLARVDFTAYTEKGLPAAAPIMNKNALLAEADTSPAASSTPTSSGINSNRVSRKSLVSASSTIPEPSPLLLALLGIFGAVIASYRKKTLS